MEITKKENEQVKNNEIEKEVKEAEKESENFETLETETADSKEENNKEMKKTSEAPCPYEYKESKEFDEKVKKMTVRERLARARLEVNRYLLTKSGVNPDKDFNYFELKDFMPIVNNVFLKYRMIGMFSFPDATQSKLVITDFDDENNKVEFTMCRVTVNGGNRMNAMQAEGAVNTYSKRYLYMNALEICDKDIFDAPQKNVNNTQQNHRNQKNQRNIQDGTEFVAPATNNQKKYINETVKQLLKSGIDSVKTQTAELMKKEGFSSLNQTLSDRYSYEKAEEVISQLNLLISYDKKKKQEVEQLRKREEDMKTQQIQNDFGAGDIVELPEGEVVVSEENIGEMEF